MSPIRIPRITTHTVLKYLFGCIAVALLLAYIVFQARVFIAGPQIILLEEPGTKHTEQMITLRGMAHNITEITLNGRAITTDERGHFEESVMLENGYTIVSISAKDRYGRKTRVTREFVYTPLPLHSMSN